ncbi:hypothetical protein C0992_001308 [Termitomyces sp. T32_za158]|nr:hypothetical protein C0992_001308 [Termitomyces sp. T32_za158]
MAAISTPHPRNQFPGRRRPTARQQILTDRAIARELQEQEEEFLLADSRRSANEQSAGQVPFIPPVIPSDDEEPSESTSTNTSTSTPPGQQLDSNGAYTPEPYNRRLHRRQNTPVIPPVIPTPPVLDGNGAYTPWPRQDRVPRQSAPVIPPVIPPVAPAASGPFIPPTPATRARNVTFAQEPHRSPQPRPTVPFIPPYPSTFNPTTSRRATTPVPPRPTLWYPPGVLPPNMRAQTPVPGMYYPPQRPMGSIVPAPPIPPIVRQRTPAVFTPPPKKTEEVIVPFIPPMPDENPTQESAERPKTPTAVKPKKVATSPENDDTQRTRALPNEPRSVLKKDVEATKSPEGSKSILEVTDNDADLPGPLLGLRKYTPIHKEISASSGLLPSLGSHLHLTCSACSTMYCRGCLRITHCRRTCTAGPDAKKCFLKTCCRAGRAIAIFTILSCFDAQFLAMVRLPRRPTYFEYIKHTLSSSSSALSDLIGDTIKSLLPWLPVEPIHSKSPPHVHASVESLFRVSLLLEVVRIYLRAPREAWVRPGNGRVYKQLLLLLTRLEEVGKRALAGLVLERRKGIERTRGVGKVVWALAERVAEKNRVDGSGRRRELGWTAGEEHESFSEILSQGKLSKDLEEMKDKVQEEQEEKKALLDHFLCQLLRWSMADALK